MPQAQIRTSWTADELFQQAIASVSDDTHWMVQSQSSQSLILRREKAVSLWKWVVIVLYGILVVITFGFALILLIFFPLLLIGIKNQQIVINIKPEDGATVAVITYTSGAKTPVKTIMQLVPQVSKSQKRTIAASASTNCSNCGTMNPTTASFCSSCGVAMAQSLDVR